MSALIQVILPIFAVLGAGALYRVVPGLPAPADVRRAIGAVVLNFFLPALTFRVLSAAPLTADLWIVPATAIVSMAACAALAWALVVKLQGAALARPVVGSLVLAAVFCNATYMGIPVVHAVVGEDLTRVPILFDLLANTPVLFTAGSVVGVAFGARAGGSVADGLRAAARLPPLVAAVAGLAANLLHRATGLAAPRFLLDACDLVGRTVSPLMIFSVGLALGRPRWRALPTVAPAVLIRLVAGPLAAWGVARALIADPRVLEATMLEAAMPTMMLTMVFAERYGLDEEALAQAILASTLASLATLPLVAALV